VRWHDAKAPLLAASLFLTTLCGCPGTSGGGGQARLLFSGLNVALMSVSGTSASDVYAVGADPGDGKGPYVLHYDGRHWRRLLTESSGDLWWISVTPIDGDFFMGGAGSQVLRYDPAADTFEPLQPPGGAGDTVFGVWGPDAAHLWAVGGDLDRPDDSGFIWNYDENTWAVVNVGETVAADLPILYKVWGRSAADVFVVGRLGTVLHFDGADWSRLPTDTTRTLFTVHGDADQVIAVGGFGDAVILEADAGSFVDRAPSEMPAMNGVCVGPEGTTVAVGIEGSVARREETGWTLEDLDFSTIRDFHATWVDPQGGIWAVGGNLSAELNDGMLAYIGTADISTTVVP